MGCYSGMVWLIGRFIGEWVDVRGRVRQGGWWGREVIQICGLVCVSVGA